MSAVPLSALVTSICALSDLSLRSQWAANWLGTTEPVEVARTLNELFVELDRGDENAQSVSFSIVDAWDKSTLDKMAVREMAHLEGLWAIERFVRHEREPVQRTHVSTIPPWRKEVGVPDYVKDRALTLGERKSLAGRPTRAHIDKLLADPHPDVVVRLLANPRLTEDDVVRVAARRTSPSAVLDAIFHTPKWLRRARVRMSLICNPATALHTSSKLVVLLLRPELELVLSSPSVADEIRALCFDRVQRRPPIHLHRIAETDTLN